jgi:hypothetical protein
MDLKSDPVSYVVAAGKPYHHLELSLTRAVAGLRSRADLTADVVATQNGDGSWPAGGKTGAPGNVPRTAGIVPLLFRAGAADAARKGAAWLAAMQRADGGFCENAALADTLKPEWEWFSAEHTVTWITGSAIVAFTTVDGYNDAVIRARDLLLRARNAEGGWPGQLAPAFKDRTDLWTIPEVVQGLLAAGVAANHDVFRDLVPALVRHREGWRDPIANPLPALLALGRRLSSPEVQEALQLLVATQNDDGGWPYLAGGDSHPDPTTAFVALFGRYGLLAAR